VTPKKPGRRDASGPAGPAADSTSGGSETPHEVGLLIAATWTVAARTGSIEPSVREILQEAGLSTKAFYRHFRSKDDLLLTAFDEGTRLLVDYLEHKMSAHDDPFTAIGAWIEGYVRQVTEPSAARRTLPWSLGIGRLAMLFPEQFDRNQAAIVAPLARQIAGAVAQGTGHSPDPERDAWLIFGYTVDTVRRHLVHDTSPDPTTVLHLVAFAHRALGRVPTAG